MKQVNWDALKKQIAELINKKLKEYGVTGCSIAVVDAEETIWSQGFGFADKEKRLKATDKTPFLIASMTKVITGTAVMQLVDRGLIDIDKPVEEYIPEFSYKTRFEDTEPITVRSLLTHHSGLSSDNFDRFYNRDPEGKDNNFRSAVDYLKENYTPYPPNYIWSYSNLGTDLLGVIIERVSCTDYCNYITENILKRLEMNNSGTITDKAIRESIAKAYNKGKREEELYLRDLPAGSVVSTASDMANFIKMAINNGVYKGIEVLSNNKLNEMFSVQNKGVILDNGFKMGLSWILDWPFFDYAGKVCWHDGSSVHYNGLMIILPERKLGLVMLSNSSTALPAFMRDIAVETLVHAVKLKSGIFPDEKDMECGSYIPKSGLYCEGRFASIMGMMEVKRIKGQLVLNMSGTNFNMLPCADGWFSLRLRLLGISLKIKKLQGMRIRIFEAGSERFLALEQNVSRHQFRQTLGKEYIHRPIPPSWRQLAGKYVPVEKDNGFIESAAVDCRNGVLSIKVFARKLGRLRFILDPITDDKAVILGVGRHAGETVYTDNRISLKVFGLVLIATTKRTFKKGMTGLNQYLFSRDGE